MQKLNINITSSLEEVKLTDSEIVYYREIETLEEGQKLPYMGIDAIDDEDYYANKSELEISLEIAKNGLYVSSTGRVIGAHYLRVNK